MCVHLAYNGFSMKLHLTEAISSEQKATSLNGCWLQNKLRLKHLSGIHWTSAQNFRFIQSSTSDHKQLHVLIKLLNRYKMLDTSNKPFLF